MEARKKIMPKFLWFVVCLVSLYCLIFFRMIFRGPPPTGEPVDWRNLPPKPDFSLGIGHTPIPLLPTTPTPPASHDPTNQNAAFFSTNTTLVDADSIARLYRALTIVTAFSENHVKEAMGLIGTVQREMPDKTIVIYDLGIEEQTLRSVKRLCRIDLRRFPFEEYPTHVSDLHTYAWKPIIIDMALREFGAIFWADSSIRFKKSLRRLVPYATRHHGYMTHFHSFDPRGAQDTPKGHIYFFTQPKMFPTLGVKRAEYFNSRNATPHASSNRQLFVRNAYLIERLVVPLKECALKPGCIAPPGARLGKHRFDASALSLLLFKNMRYEWTLTNNDNQVFDEVVEIRRTVIDWHLAQKCA